MHWIWWIENMSEVKIFRVTGEINKPNFKTKFRKEVRALKEEDAADRIYKEVGSKHRAKRFQIKILKIEQISLEEVADPIVKKLSLGETENAQ
jgi:large subunit ribosomal protein LX